MSVGMGMCMYMHECRIRMYVCMINYMYACTPVCTYVRRL